MSDGERGIEANYIREAILCWRDRAGSAYLEGGERVENGIGQNAAP